MGSSSTKGMALQLERNNGSNCLEKRQLNSCFLIYSKELLMNPVKVRYENGKLRQEINIGHHHLVTDVALSEGGEDLGPSPHELLAAALGACTAITIRMYALRKKWPHWRMLK